MVLKAYPRGSFEVVTSCGYVRHENGFRVSGKPDDVRKDLDESLQRMGLDYVDVYYSHIPDPNTPLAETASAMERLREAGLIKHIGISNVNKEQTEQYLQGAKIEWIQNRLSYLNREIPDELIALAKTHGLHFSVYQVIERGILSGRGPNLVRPDDLRHRKPEFKSASLGILRAAVEELLMPLAKSHGFSLEQAAILWCLSQPCVGAVQVGLSRVVDVQGLPWNGKASGPLLASLETAFLQIEQRCRDAGYSSVRNLMGLDNYDVRSGSASGR